MNGWSGPTRSRSSRPRTKSSRRARCPSACSSNAPAQVVADGVIVASYSRYEPIKLTEGLHEALGELGPKETVAEVRARLLRDHGLDLPELMLFELYRLGVLVPVAGAPAAP